jgi:DNA-directed RNA polymerase specialized sigma24 family protein
MWERWPDIDQVEDVTAYLYRIALNGFRMRVRRARTAARRAVVEHSTPDPFADVELRQDVRQMLLGLTVRQRAARS